MIPNGLNPFDPAVRSEGLGKLPENFPVKRIGNSPHGPARLASHLDHSQPFPVTKNLGGSGNTFLVHCRILDCLLCASSVALCAFVVNVSRCRGRYFITLM